jgi:uncharacterized protein YndB with AHSA1/START domain
MTEKPEDFTLTYQFKATPAAIYQATATRDGIAGWWTTDTDYDDRPGSVAHMRFPGNGFFTKMKVLALKPDALVHWKCIDAGHPPDSGFADLRDWVGTEVKFEIEPVSDEKTKLKFTHVGLGPLECHGLCSSIWSFYIGTSLRSLVETGTGQPHVTEGGAQ